MVSTNADALHDEYRGTDTLIFGIVLAVITFWLFAQTTLNVAPTMRDELRISESLTNIAVSIASLFSGTQRARYQFRRIVRPVSRKDRQCCYSFRGCCGPVVQCAHGDRRHYRDHHDRTQG